MKFISLILFLPHLILFGFSSNKETIIRDLYARKERTKTANNISADLSLELMSSRYFRTLFYYRTRSLFSKILRIFYPDASTFTIDIHTKLGAGLKLAHPYATIINAESVGENCYINHLVTIGEKNGKKPTIGNNVEMHANCSIIGGINIGDSAVIGAGAVIVKDVPSGAVMVGNPAKNIRSNV